MSKLSTSTRFPITAAIVAGLTVGMSVTVERSAWAQMDTIPIPMPMPGISLPNPSSATEPSSAIEAGATSSSSKKAVRLADFALEQDGFGFANGEVASKMRSQVRKVRKSLSSRHTAYHNLLTLLFGKERTCTGGADHGKCRTTFQSRVWASDQALSAVESGVCDGIAVASQMLWVIQQESRANPFGTRSKNLNQLLKAMKNSGSSIAQLSADSQSLQNFLLELYTGQTADEIYQQEAASRQKTLANILAQIQRSISNYSPGNGSWKDLVTISIYRRNKNNLNAGHTLVPFKVEQDGSSTKVAVYDANYPGKTQYLVFNGNTWTYQPEGSKEYEGNSNSKNLGVLTLGQRTIPYASKNGFASCPFCADPASNLEITQVDGSHKIYDSASKLETTQADGGNKIYVFKDEYKEQELGFHPRADFNQQINTIINAKVVKDSEENPKSYIIPGALDAYGLGYAFRKETTGNSYFPKGTYKLRKPGISVQVQKTGILYFYNPNPDRLAFNENDEIWATLAGDTADISYKVHIAAKDRRNKYYIVDRKTKRVYFGGVNWDTKKTATAKEVALTNVGFSVKLTRTVDGKESVIEMKDVRSRSSQFNYIDLRTLPWDSSQKQAQAQINTGRVPKCIAFPGVVPGYPNGFYESVDKPASYRWSHCMREYWKTKLGKSSAASNYTARSHRGDSGDSYEDWW